MLRDRARKRSRKGRGCALVLAAALLAAAAACAARVPLLQAAGRFLVEDNPPEKADAIVVLAGSLPERILEGAMLYREGFAPRLVISREPDSTAYAQLRTLGVRVPTRHEISRSIAEQLGVPPEAIRDGGGLPGSTRSEAEVLVELMRREGFRSVLLVTSRVHTRRAAMIYRDLAGPSVRMIVRPSRFDDFLPEAWWHDRTSTRRLIFEYEKLLLYVVLERWRGPSR